jgi:guanylate kinase
MATVGQGRDGGNDPGARPPALRGTLLVLSAPSGAGKTTLVKGLLQRDPSLRFSVSYTTRAPRAGEQHGRDYFFVAEPVFRDMLERGEFLEHANVFGNLYGTSRTQVDELLEAGVNVLLEIDCQGARQVRANAPGCRSIFIMPPTRGSLEKRLRGRGTDPDDVIARRLAGSMQELAQWPEFDYVVVNEDGALDASLDALQAIVSGRGQPWSSRAPALRQRLEALVAL